jgi:hypothetical protein
MVMIRLIEPTWRLTLAVLGQGAAGVISTACARFLFFLLQELIDSLADYPRN